MSGNLLSRIAMIAGLIGLAVFLAVILLAQRTRIRFSGSAFASVWCSFFSAFYWN